MQRRTFEVDARIGRAIRATRHDQGRTLEHVAKEVGVTGAQLHRYETGSSRISAERLVAIAKALGVAIDVLVQADKPAEQPPPTLLPPRIPDHDIIELLELFNTIKDPQQRKVVLAVARTLTRGAG